MLLLRDVTDIKRAAEALQKAQGEERHSTNTNMNNDFNFILNPNQIPPSSDFEELLLAPTICEEEFLMSFLDNWSHRFIVSLLTRTGRFVEPEVSNHSPIQVHKDRTIQVTTSQSCPPCEITFHCMLTSGNLSGEYLYLRSGPDGTPTNFVRYVHEGGAVTIDWVRLITRINRQETPGNANYLVSVSVKFQNGVGNDEVLHQFTTQPIRNHKWESTKPGKTHHNLNAIPIVRDICEV